MQVRIYHRIKPSLSAASLIEPVLISFPLSELVALQWRWHLSLHMFDEPGAKQTEAIEIDPRQIVQSTNKSGLYQVTWPPLWRHREVLKLHIDVEHSLHIVLPEVTATCDIFHMLNRQRQNFEPKLNALICTEFRTTVCTAFLHTSFCTVVQPRHRF